MHPYKAQAGKSDTPHTFSKALPRLSFQSIRKNKNFLKSNLPKYINWGMYKTPKNIYFSKSNFTLLYIASSEN